MIPIGRFSKMTRLSLKALRLYDENGLLPPAHIDSETGYRYYQYSQANRAEAIRILRSVDMPLDEIKLVLESQDSDFISKQLSSHRERLKERISQQEHRLNYLDSFMNRRESIMPYNVDLLDTEPQQIAAVKVKTSLASIQNDIKKGFGTLVSGIEHSKIVPNGAPMIVYLSTIDQETEGEIEIAIPINSAFPDGASIYARELEGGKMASTIHHGPYEEITPAYHTLVGWVTENNYEFAGPPREIYLNDPQLVSADKLQTRVEFPICKKA